MKALCVNYMLLKISHKGVVLAAYRLKNEEDGDDAFI